MWVRGRPCGVVGGVVSAGLYRADMEQRISLITLGTGDLAAARRFYEALGWHSPADAGADTVFFQTGGLVVALWSRSELAEDSCVVDTGGWGGITLAHNVRSPAEVDAVLEQAAAAGGRVARRGAPTSWGGYSGLFLDLDGHPWEVAHNPFWAVTEDGRTLLDPQAG